MEQPPQNQNLTPQQSDTNTASELFRLFMEMNLAKAESELEFDKLRIELEKARLEAEQKTELQNKLYGWGLVVMAMAAYTALLWYGKASEGYGVLITAIVTSALSGIFKGIVGRKRKGSGTDVEN
ncbi:hypothetical protein [Salmonirosea aquatica]|uniref:DUF2335 domain-containing protein n=1 Tax=Salmonirosea aquatica TaxID=2654236 RepID=A0A7C9F4R6_9BACT|nr:hypothetical protein [Cytophagaceae bacterium SJW1-29]